MNPNKNLETKFVSSVEIGSRKHIFEIEVEAPILKLKVIINSETNDPNELPYL